MDLKSLTATAEGLPAGGDLAQLCEHLIAKGALTQWQCENLRAGKYKGFFVGEFKLEIGYEAASLLG